jgi:hypothetical protein
MVPLICGAFLIAMAIVADRFYVGLGARVQVSGWQGRTWLLLLSIPLFMVGLASVLHWSTVAVWQRALDNTWNAFELFNGVLMMLLGAVFAVAGRGKVPTQFRWIALAVSTGGAIFAFDAVTKFMH